MQKLIKNISKHKYKTGAVGYTVWLTAVSLTPLRGVHLPSFVYADKIVHFFLYFFLMLVWLKACPRFYLKKYRFLTVVILWGIGIEFLQEYLIQGRTGDIFDALANSTGGLAALYIYRLFR